MTNTDVLIREVPDDELAAIDRAANERGQTRATYIRRLLSTVAERRIRTEEARRITRLAVTQTA